MRRRAGQSLVEYAILLGVVTVGCIGVVGPFMRKLEATWHRAAARLDAAFEPRTPRSAPPSASAGGHGLAGFAGSGHALSDRDGDGVCNVCRRRHGP